jgi:3-phosphoshikimate 1-carboxyvinyltransferase
MTPPPDKSITHRALMLAGLADGASTVDNPLDTGDCRSTRACLEALGVPIREQRLPSAGAGEAAGAGPKTEGCLRLLIDGKGLRGLTEPTGVLDAGNSGTTMRLLAGVLAGLPLFAVISGDPSLRSRPMLRVVEPLRGMGAEIRGRAGGRLAPLVFLPGTGSLKALRHVLPVASAQVKSALMFAALRAEAPVSIGGATGSRDHSERLFRHLGLPLSADKGVLVCSPVSSVAPLQLSVPGDISSAAFFLAAALLGGRGLEVRGCGLNPTRTGFVEILRRMGARIEVQEQGSSGGEPVGSLRVLPGPLHSTEVLPAEVPLLIDEIPLLAVLGALAEGETRVAGAEELRHKESDRLEATARLLAAVGGALELRQDGFSVQGPQKLHPGNVDPRGDHRLAMAGAVLAAAIPGGVTVSGFEAAQVSYPDFVSTFRQLGGSAA